MEIRKATTGDEDNLIKLFSALESETQFMLMEPDENTLTIESQAQLINEFAQSTSKTIFVASENNQLIGFLGGTGGCANRERHSIKIAMGVLTSYWRKGVGTQLLQEFFKWADEHNFHRIELNVMENNIAAIALYSKIGFEIEGLKRDSMKVNENYINEFLMSKLI